MVTPYQVRIIHVIFLYSHLEIMLHYLSDYPVFCEKAVGDKLRVAHPDRLLALCACFLSWWGSSDIGWCSSLRWNYLRIFIRSYLRGCLSRSSSCSCHWGFDFFDLFLKCIHLVLLLLLFASSIFLSLVLPRVWLLGVELFEWVVHLQDMNTDQFKLCAAKVMSRCRLLSLSLLSQHLLLDLCDWLSCILVLLRFLSL